MDKSFFRDQPLTRGFNATEIEKLTSHLQERHFEVGEKICSAGAATLGLYLLRKGRVAISAPAAQGVEHHVTHLDAPTALGELELMTRQPAFATALVETPTQGYLLTHDAFEKLVNEGDALVTKLTRNVARIVIQRLVESNARVVESMYQQKKP